MALPWQDGGDVMHECRFYSDRKLVMLILSGDLTVEDVMHGLQELIGDSRFSPEFVGLCDLRRARVHADDEETERLAEFVVKTTTSEGKWAYLVNRPQSTALTGFYGQIVAEKHPAKVFSTVGAAAAYLKTRLNDLLI